MSSSEVPPRWGSYLLSHLDPALTRWAPLLSARWAFSGLLLFLLATTAFAQIRFDDIAAKAGLKFELRNGATGEFHQPELMLGGVAVLDYNNDGCM